METEKLSFEQVCAEYEFAEWELTELVERGEIAATLDGEGGMYFELDEILRFYRVTPTHFFSFRVAQRIYGKTAKNFKQQASKGVLRAKKISDRWAVNAQQMDDYMENHAHS